MKVIGTLLFLLLITPFPVFAAPYFYFNAGTTATENINHTISVYLVTDGSRLTAAETVVSYDPVYFDGAALSVIGSRCSFWAPPDPSLGYGTNPTPSFQSGGKVPISCGFANPGYLSPDSTGHLIAEITLTPNIQGTTGLSFQAANTNFRFIGSTIAAGAMSDISIDIEPAPDSSTTPGPTATSTPTGGPTATPTPTPTPTATSTSSSSSSSSSTSSSGSSSSDTLTASDLTFVEIGSKQSVQTVSEASDVSLEVVEEDDSIPGIPFDLELRARATPFLFSLLGGGGGAGVNSQSPQGEVLSAQSLRELLIPGKSKADKTVVMVNLISTLTFLTLLAVVIWRLITISRLNQLKSKHMKDFLASELAAIESKIGAIDTPESRRALKDNLSDTLKKISGDFNNNPPK